MRGGSRAALALVLVLGACTTAGTQGRMEASRARATIGQATAGAPSSAGQAPASVQAPRQLIRRGDLTIEVADPADVARRVEREVVDAGGYVARSSVESDGRRATFELRVPAERLDATMDRLAALGKVRRRGVNTVDVTEQATDLDARRGALAATRDRLQELLKRAAGVSDIVQIERELARVQGELDSMDRRLTALRGQVALSELDVTLERRIVLGPLGLLFKGVGTVIGKLFVWR